MEATKQHTDLGFTAHLLIFTGYLHNPIRHTICYSVQENGLNRFLIGRTPAELETEYEITPLKIGPRTRCTFNTAYQKIENGTKIKICAEEEVLRDFEERLGLASEEDLNFEKNELD